ncbi:MAG: CvpA family protein [Elusimicrobia bacterium]|nr:CvpA family protein [Elusimicrobiota bacterium]
MNEAWRFMTWIDVTGLVVFFLFLAIGARLGSLWTAACLLAGFAAACAADTYGYPLADRLGSMPGAVTAAEAAVFAAVALVVLIPGWVLSKFSEGILLGVVDSVCGLVTGAVAGLLAIGAVLLVLVAATPSLEASGGWRHSMLVKPFYWRLEAILQAPRFHRPARVRAADWGKPLRERAGDTLKSAADRIADRLKG